MPTIFLAEDNTADVELFRMALEEAGLECELLVFGDGRAIMDRIHSLHHSSEIRPPDLIILDLNMPKSDGFEVLETIRQTPLLAEVPLAVLSSSFSHRDREKLAAYNVRQFILKPADLEEYLAIGGTVRDLLNRRDRDL